MSIEVIKQALQYIEANAETKDEHEIATGLRQAIAEAEKQEPVAWMDRDGDIYKELPNEYWNPPHTPIYAQREWVGLTDEEFDFLVPYCFTEFDLNDYKEFARDIEDKLRSKNNNG